MVDPASLQNSAIYVCIITSEYVHIYKFMFNSLISRREYILISSMAVSYQVDYFTHVPCLFLNLFPCQQKEDLPCIHCLSCLVSVCIDNDLRIIRFTPLGDIIVTRAHAVHSSEFLLQTGSRCHIACGWSFILLSYTSFSEAVLTCKMIRVFSCTFHSVQRLLSL